MPGPRLATPLVGALALALWSGAAQAGAARPDPLADEAGCDHYRGTPKHANDSTQLFELIVCTTPEGVRAKVQTSSLVSGWSVRQSVGSWDASGTKLTLRDTHFIESRPEPSWRFCLIDELALEKTEAGLVGTYVSEPCDDRATLELKKLAPIDAEPGSRASPRPAPAEPAPAPSSVDPPSEPSPAPQTATEAAPSGCGCRSDGGAPLSPLLVVLLLGLGARRRSAPGA